MSEKRLSQATDIEVRAIPAQADGEAETTIIRGYAAVYESDSLDLGGFIERVARTAFDRTLSEGRKIDAYWNHNPGQPLASTRSGGLKLVSDQYGLAFELDPRRMDPMMLDAVRSGDAGVSFGFQKREDTWEFPDNGPARRTLNDVDLFEVSLTVIPAYPATEASFRSMEEARAATNVVEAEPSEPFNSVRIALLKRWADSVLSKPV